MAAEVDWPAQSEHYRLAVEEALAEPEPRERIHALRAVVDELDGLREWAAEHLDEAVEEASAEVWRLAFRQVRENADMREELVRRGMSTPERCDRMGLVSHEALDEAAEQGELYEAAFGALGKLGNVGGGGGLVKFLEKLHPRDRGGKFARKPGSGKLTALVGRDGKTEKGVGPVGREPGGRGTVKRTAKAPAGKKERVFKTQDVTPAELAVQSKEGLAPGQRPAGMSPAQAAQERARTAEVGRQPRGTPQTEEQKKAAAAKDRAKREKGLTKRVGKEVGKGAPSAEHFNPAEKVSQKSLLGYVKNALSTPSTADAHSEMRGDQRVYHADRKQLHDAIIDTLLRQRNEDFSLSASNDYLPSQDNPQVLFMGGGYAAGKSSARKILQGRGDVPEDAIVIDPDQIKSMLPEFAATATHDPEANLRVYEEAWDVAQELQRQAQEKKLNVVVDGITNTSPDEVFGRVQSFKDAGYGDARIAYVDVPTDVALKRVGDRAKKAIGKAEAGDPSAASDMRHIPEVIVRAVHRDVAATIPAVMNDPRRKDIGVSVDVYDGQSNALAVASVGATDESPTIHHDPAFKRLLEKGDEKIGGVDAPKSETDPFAKGRIEQEHSNFFNVDENTPTVPLDKLRPSKPPESQPHSVDTAERLMGLAAKSEVDKRDPISVEARPDGTYRVVDGNATLGAAIRNDWKDLPVNVLNAGSPEAKAAEAASAPKPRKNEAEAQKIIEGATADLQGIPAAPPPQPFHSEEELYAVAQKAQEGFLDVLDRGIGVSADLNAKTHAMVDGDKEFIDKQFADAVAAVEADPNTPHIVVAPLKGKERAREKVDGKYKGDWSRLSDVVRGTVVVPNVQGLSDALEAVKKEALARGWTVSALENRMTEVPGSENHKGPTGSGYTDFNIRLESPEGLHTELQFNTSGMFLAKQGEGHTLFEEERAIMDGQAARGLPLSAAQRERVFELRKQQMALYGKAWDEGI